VDLVDHLADELGGGERCSNAHPADSPHAGDFPPQHPDFPPHVGPVEFFVRAVELERRILKLDIEPFHALFALKRSGWVLGAMLSNRLRLPVFTRSEIESIPEGFERILVVDTVSWTGRSLRRSASRLRDAGAEFVHAAVLFAHEKHDVGVEFDVTVGDVCLHIPVFFFHEGFRYEFCRDAEFAERVGKM
jgi:hypothetical protein